MVAAEAPRGARNGSETISAKIEDGDEFELSHDFSDTSARSCSPAGCSQTYARARPGNGASKKAEYGGGRAEQEDAGEREGQGVGGHHE